MDGLDYNHELIEKLQDVVSRWKTLYPDVPIEPMKADYLAERSIQDNIELESS